MEALGHVVPDFQLDTFEPSKCDFGRLWRAKQRAKGRWPTLVFVPADDHAHEAGAHGDGARGRDRAGERGPVGERVPRGQARRRAFSVAPPSLTPRIQSIAAR